jgi:hypothetical protein
MIANRSYFYRVVPTGVEHASRQIGITAGLPRNWSEHSYGEAFPAGSTDVAADVFIVQAYGTYPFGHSDELHFVHSTPTGDGVLTARLSPLLASQAATVGLMLRTDERLMLPWSLFRYLRIQGESGRSGLCRYFRVRTQVMPSG